MPYQGLQLAHLGRRWRPGFGLLGAAEIGNQRGIQFIRLITSQLAGGITSDAGWIDHTHPVTRRVQILGHAFAVTPRRFQTYRFDWPLAQPVLQLGIAAGRIVPLTILRLALLIHPHHVQRIFADINPQHSHVTPPTRSSTAWPPAQPTLYTSSRGFPQRASDTVRLLDLGRHARDSSTLQGVILQGRASLSSVLAAFLPIILHDTRGESLTRPGISLTLN